MPRPPPPQPPDARPKGGASPKGDTSPRGDVSPRPHDPGATRALTLSTEDGLLSLTGFLRFGVWVEDGYLSLRAFRSLFLSL
nr:hypothetical protein CFP56_59415 [Quercus suber]